VASPQDHIPKGKWWEVFDDETLNWMQELGLAHNHNLKSAMASVEEARAIARINRGEFFPAVGSDPEFRRTRTTANSFTSTSASASSFISENYTVPFDLTYEIDLWGRLRRKFESGHAKAEATLAEYYAIMLTLNADIAQNYFLLRELDKEIAIIDETIVLREYAVKVVTERVKGGITSELNLNLAKSVLAEAQADRVDIIRRRKELENALAVLCGQLPSEFEVESQAMDIITPVIPMGVPSQLLERRPDIAEAERLVEKANADIGVAQAAFFPTLTLFAEGGVKSVGTDNLFNWESRFWSLGPSFSVPIFSGGRATANLEAKQAAYDKTVEDYRQTVLSAIEEVETSLSNLKSRQRQDFTHFEALQAYRETAEMSIARYEEGLVTFLEVIDAERSRLDAELESTRITTQELIAAVQLIKALGGSWED
ncbi:MAG: efflux transporter outer membrane subunit, partial [Candidatus Omnitrophica bacterium]|nr:efflux transporter outer membrane subunit [Candidatus Omnitrophota bacterium]